MVAVVGRTIPVMKHRFVTTPTNNPSAVSLFKYTYMTWQACRCINGIDTVDKGEESQVRSLWIMGRVSAWVWNKD